jgi:dipeptidyl aminopeptidase/acylaminoacyl peptidase
MDTTFDLDTFLAQPRLGGLVLSPDGQRLVIGVATPAPDGSRFRTALWQVDPAGEAPPRQLTRGAPSESPVGFLPDGTLLFVAPRPDPDATPDGDPPAALWALPAGGGEARLLVSTPAGVSGVSLATASDTVVVHSAIHPGAETLAADRDHDKARTDAKVGAQLLDDYPLRLWDQFLGPREPGRWVFEVPPEPDTPTIAKPSPTDATPADGGDPDADAEAAVDEPRLLVRGGALTLAQGALSPDGATLVTGWGRRAAIRERSDPGVLANDLIAIDVATGERRVVVADGRDYAPVAVSPDGRMVACLIEEIGQPGRSERLRLGVVALDTGAVTELADELDRWPNNPQWLPDGHALVFEADDRGHRRIFRVDIATDTVTALTADGAYTDVTVAPDGATLFAMYATIDTPHRPVRLDTSTPAQEPIELRSPVGSKPANVRVERLEATADDGTSIGSWLVLPTDVEGPAPLAVVIHGGPRGSWNTWHWRWSPHVIAAEGYAVLLPDPAQSTGYGQDFHDRGWGSWGDEPYTDLMAAVDAAEQHADIDATRTAALGGSFGGYMANWIAGHTDRFRCLVTHASLWNLPAFHGTTDIGLFWETEFGDPYLDRSRYEEHSPHRFVTEITTPMLVIHGEQDYRVPFSEALMLMTDLKRNGVDARLLYFPDENHWILKPQNARIWYETVLAFLGEHLDDTPFERPALL